MDYDAEYAFWTKIGPCSSPFSRPDDWRSWFGAVFNPIGVNESGFEFFYVDDDVDPHAIPPVPLNEFIRITGRAVQQCPCFSMYEVNMFRMDSRESLRYRFVHSLMPRCWAGYLMITIVPKRQYRNAILADYFGCARDMYNSTRRQKAVEIFAIQYDFVMSMIESVKHTIACTLIRWELALECELPSWMAPVISPVYNDPADGKVRFHIDSIKNPERYVDGTLTAWCRRSGCPGFAFYRIACASPDCMLIAPGIEAWWTASCANVLVVVPERRRRARIAAALRRAEGYFLVVPGAQHAYDCHIRILRKQFAVAASKLRVAYSELHSFRADGSD